MGPEVTEREKNREGFLHPEKTDKGPFAVVLDDWVREGGRRLGEARGGGEVLTGVVAFGGAGPEEETAVEGWWEVVRSLLELLTKGR